MTIEMKQFGKFLITRQHAKRILGGMRLHEPPVLDFAGVEVANHPFVDQFARGIAAQLSLSNLKAIRIENANDYTRNCVNAGFATASAH
jgi:hypothetical protein